MSVPPRARARGSPVGRAGQVGRTPLLTAARYSQDRAVALLLRFEEDETLESEEEGAARERVRARWPLARSYAPGGRARCASASASVDVTRRRPRGEEGVDWGCFPNSVASAAFCSEFVWL